MRVLRILLVVALGLGTLACSNDNKASTKKRNPLKAEASFGTLPGNTDPRNICGAYPIKNIKALLGGGKQFRQFVPEKLKDRGPGSTGVECRWQGGGPSKGDGLTLRVDAIDYAKAEPGKLDGDWKGAKDSLRSLAPVPNLGDEAVSGTINHANTVTARKGTWMITVSTAANGKAEASPIPALVLLAAAAVAKV